MPNAALASVYGQRGIVATADLVPGEVVLSVPLKSSLVASAARLKACPLPTAFVNHTYWVQNSG